MHEAKKKIDRSFFPVLFQCVGRIHAARFFALVALLTQALAV